MSRPAKSKTASAPTTAGKSSAASGRDKLLTITVCLGLALAVWLAFGESLRNGFVNYDDDIYVYENAMVRRGLTLPGIRWALTYGEIGHWHPLTWVSHMLDYQMFGLNAGGHHLTSVLIHMVAAVLLFLVLRRMTGSLWRSAFVGAVFAVHPLRVESVVWVSERKDVLGALFFVLTIGAYVRYVRQPSRLRCATVSLVYAGGLLCKNMLVTLPFILLLLDYWPLKRFSLDDFRWMIGRLVREKIPLFALTVASCVATFLASEKLTAAKLPLFLRVENAVVSYVAYLRQTFWPAGLAGLYPNPENGLPPGDVVLALAWLLVTSAAVFVWRRKRPFLVVGWLWYLGMLVPVIGFVQISFYARADRYTYLPQIGIILLVTWLVNELAAPWRHRRLVLGLAAAVIVPALIVCTRRQTGYWRDSEVFWKHTLACTVSNSIAHNNLAMVLRAAGRTEDALAHLRSAMEISPLFAKNRYDMGIIFLERGDVDQAIASFEKAVLLQPSYAEAHNNLGAALYQQGRAEEALAQFLTVVGLTSHHAKAHYNAGTILLERGDREGARAHYSEALGHDPGLAEAHYGLGLAAMQEGQRDQADASLRRALALRPDFAAARTLLDGLATPPAPRGDGIRSDGSRN